MMFITIYDVYHLMQIIASSPGLIVKSKQHTHARADRHTHSHSVYDSNAPVLIEQSTVTSPREVERQDRGNLHPKAT